MNDDPGSWFAMGKIIGVGSGTFISLVFIPPKTLRECAVRVAIALFVGFIFSVPLREYLGWSEDIDHVIAASALAAFVSWWAAGLIVRVLNAKSDFSKP